MRVPRLLSHIFDSESKTVSFGWWVFISATAGLFLGRVISADNWILCVAIASTLIGGKLVGETVLKVKQIKETPDAPIQPPPPQP